MQRAHKSVASFQSAAGESVMIASIIDLLSIFHRYTMQ